MTPPGIPLSASRLERPTGFELYNSFRVFFLISIIALTGGCAVPASPPTASPVVADHRLDELNHAIRSLRDDIHPGEAQRAARTALEYSRQLAREYRASDSALLHNLKVNLGLRDRGLCVHWTRDLMARLRLEGFTSLDLHWGIANYESAFRLEHSSVIVSARGDTLEQGLVLDPWRFSGDLYWAPASQDPGYRWRSRAEIHALKKQHASNSRHRNPVR